jgi:uncharacterized protein YqgQ
LGGGERLKHIDKISDYLKDKADTIDRINKILGEPCTNNSSEAKQKFEELKKELEMATNRENVRQFIDLLVNEEETIENAAKVSGISDMKLVDVLKTISEMEFESIKAFSSAVAGMNSMKEAIQTIKNLDSTLVDLKKNKEDNELTQEELRNLYKERLMREKQTYISKIVGIDGSILSKFKLGKIDLYPQLFSKLENYLINS